MMSLAPVRRGPFTASVSGTRTFHRRRMKKFATSSGLQLAWGKVKQMEKAEGRKNVQNTTESILTKTVREGARTLAGASQDYDPLIDLVGDAHFVLIGEASHGTHDFYHERAQITERLIQEKGFTGVAVEGDWPDAYRVNRYVRDASDDAFAVESLGDFRRFPAWIWRNTAVVEFFEWLPAH